MTERADVTIIGGGAAGLVAAIALARLGLKAVVLERNARPVWKIGETLAPEAAAILSQIGVTDAALKTDGHLPSPGTCSAWGGEDLAFKDFLFNPNGCGWQLDRVRFEEMLQSRAKASGVKLCRGLSADRFERDRGQWKIEINGQLLNCEWLVDASGRGAVVARHFGETRTRLDQLVSIYSIYSSEAGTDLNARTLIEATPEGWWYSALAPNGRRTVAFQTDADLASNYDWRNSEWLRAKVHETQHVRAVLEGNGLTMKEPPRLISAQSGRLGSCQGNDWIAVGDAALCFDPLSGQGLLTAMLTGLRAAQTIAGGVNTESAADYTTLIELLWSRFVDGRRRFYRLEQRWPSRMFWKRRLFGE